MSLSLPSKGGKQVGLNKKQADAIRERVKKKRDARALAREEERNYVEFRKMEILYQFRPKSIAASRNADDKLTLCAGSSNNFQVQCLSVKGSVSRGGQVESFPRRRRGVNMGFGERKAYFLSIRPNPKFATWFGKKKHQPPADNKNKILLPISPAPVRQVVQEKSQIVDEDDEEDLSRRSAKKGINASNPFIKGCPFWTVATGDEEEMAEDDYPVDIEAIEKVVNGAELKRPPYVRKDFQIFAADVDTFKKDDILFDRELIFGNTVTTVLNLFCADSTKKSTKKKTKTVSMSAEKCVTWANTISITTFDVENREPKKKRVPQEEPMKNVVRMSAEGSKE